jgi:hypothetical protein
MKWFSGPPAELSKSLHQRLNIYALAAGAADIRYLTTRSPLNWPNPIQQAFLDKSRVKSIQQRIYLCDQCPCLRF